MSLDYKKIDFHLYFQQIKKEECFQRAVYFCAFYFFIAIENIYKPINHISIVYI